MPTELWVIQLENDQGQRGYFSMLAGDGIRTTVSVEGAQHFHTEDAAEECLYRLEARFGLNREEAQVMHLAGARLFNLVLHDGTDFPDGIGVQEIKGSGGSDERILVIRNAGFEVSESLSDEVADALVVVLDKIRQRIRANGTSQNG